MTEKSSNTIKKVRRAILRKFPLLGVTLSKMKFEETELIPTAATDGEKILFNEKFLDSLSFDEKTFLVAHELLHVEFDHIMRSKNRDGNLWNIATDAVINQILQSAKLPMIEGGVDMKEALNKSAEEMYEKLKKEQEQNQQQNQNEQQEQQQNNSGQGHPQHDIWKEAIKQRDKQEQQKKQQNQQQPTQQPTQNDQGEQNKIQDNSNQAGNENNQIEKEQQNSKGNGQEENNSEDKQKDSLSEQQSGENGDNQQTLEQEINAKNDKNSQKEKSFSDKNNELKEKVGEEIRKKLQQGRTAGDTPGEASFKLDNIVEQKPVLNWKKILRREFEKEDDRWSYRRAEADNYYQARIGSMENDDQPITEILLDTSGSVDENMLRSFLMQIIPILKESKVFVGCFDTRFYGFSEIKSKKEITDFRFKGRGGTNFNVAVSAFSKDKNVNKIIFTDGRDTLSEKEEFKKIKNLYWLVWDKSSNLKPCVGKVIEVDTDSLQLMIDKPKDSEIIK